MVSTLSPKMVDTAGGLIVIWWDPGGHIKFLDRKTQEATGYEDGEVLGNTWKDVSVPPNTNRIFRGTWIPSLRKVLYPAVRNIPYSRKTEGEFLSRWTGL